MLEKDPAARYPHGRAVMIALDEAVRSIESGAGRALPALPEAWKRSAPLAIAGAALLVVIVVAWVVLSHG
jgi:hypothetical protein